MVLTLHAIWPSVSWKHSLLTFLEPNIHFLTNRILAGIPLHRTTTVTRAASIETGEIWEIFWRLQGKRPGLHSNFCHPFKSNFTGDEFCLQRPLPTTLQRPTRSTLKYASIFQSFIEVLGVVIFSKISYHAYKSLKRVDLDYLLEKTIEKSQQILESAIAVPYHLSNVFVEFPLKELYRHGPSFLGWEGDSLPRICARITYHGDPEFWSLNMDEYQRVYDSKEAAALHFWKPVLMLIWAIGVLYMVRSIFATWALRRRERLDPDIVETYQAIRMLFRQFRRAMDTP
mmetsp:Transcript_29024/g.59175  ORF Transcript_29024/g.59175 Transcript_29024/m.59175 type:complete len:286 (-) Transcript_29024:80-937(-)